MAGDRNPYQTFPAMVYCLNREGCLIEVSDDWLTKLGYTRPEVIGQPITAFLTPESQSTEQTVTLPALEQQGHIRNVAYQLLSKAGTAIHVLLSAQAEYDLTHHWTGTVVVLTEMPRYPLEATSHRAANLERIQGVAASPASAMRLQQVLHTMPIMFNAFDEAGRIIAWNQECERVTGYTAAEVVNYPNVMVLFDPDANCRVHRGVSQCVNQHPYRDWEGQLQCKDGQIKTIAWSNLSDDHPITGWARWGIGINITDRKQTEQALRESEMINRALRHTIPDLLICMDRNGTYLDVTIPADFPLVSPLVAVGANIRDILPLEAAQVRMNAAERALETGLIQVYEFPLLIDRRQHWQEVRIVPMDADKVMVMIRNVTQRREAEDALKRREHYFRAITENASDIVAVLDANGHFLYVTPTVVKVLDYTLADVIGRPATKFVPAEDVPKVLAGLAKAINAPKVNQLSGEYRILAKDGSVRTFEASAISLLEDPIVRGIVVNCRDISERRQLEAERQQAEAALRQNEMMFRSLSACSPVGIYMADFQGNYTYLNPRAQEIYGLTAEEAMGRGWVNRVHPEDQPWLLSTWVATTTSGHPYKADYRLQNQGGKIRWVRTQSAPMQASHGEFLGHVGTVEDITERKQSELAIQQLNAALAEQNQHLEQLVEQRTSELLTFFNALPDGIFVINRQDMRILFCNEAYTHRHFPHLSPIDLQGKTIFECYLPERAQFLAELNQQVFESGEILHQQYPMETATGGMITDVYRIPLKRSNGEVYALIGASRNITELVQTRAALARRTTELQAIFEALPDYVYVHEGSSFALTLCNDRQVKFLGFDCLDQIQGKSIEELIEPKHLTQILEQNKQILDFGISVRAQEAWDTPSGKRYFDTIKVPLKNSQNQVYGLLGVTRDMTELFEAREALAQRTAQLEVMNKELESFSYSVSHDLRAPLRHINGFVSALRTRLESNGSMADPRIEHYLQVIHASSDRMGSLIDGLLTLSRIGRRNLSKRVIQLRPLVEKAIELVKSDRTLAQDIDFVIGGLPWVEGDPALLQQVFTNLIDNAVKFSQPSQQASTSASVADRPRVEIGVLADNHTLFVRDHGVGFQMEYADKLFSPFQRLHATQDFEGSGIGLAIVQRIIHRHQGQIWAEGHPCQGASFYFTLNTIEPQ